MTPQPSAATTFAAVPIQSLNMPPQPSDSTPFTAFVPVGSIERGRRLAATVGRTKATACVTCHGPSLKGVKEVPPIAGRSPSYIFRQLLAFQTGARNAAASAPMRTVVAGMSLDDMIAVSAYAGSRQP